MDDGTADAVVIGSGPNGLVAANLLVDRGWDVVVVEAQPRVGGAVSSDEAVHEGFVHDTFSSFYPLAAVSPTIGAMELERWGLRWAHAPAVVGTPFVDGTWAMLHRTPEETAADLDSECPGDGQAWMAMCRDWQRIGDDLIGALLAPFPPVRSGIAAASKLRKVGGLSFVRSLVVPARTMARQAFGGRRGPILLAGNAAHADLPLDGAGSGFMGWLLVMMGQHHGYPVPEGGAGMLTAAMARRLEQGGGRIRLSTRAVEVVVRDGRAVGVRTEHGDTLLVRRAVVADVDVTSLYGDLVPWDALPASLRARMQRFEWDPGTVKVDWALSRPVPWDVPPDKAPGTVHLAESMAEIATAGAQIGSGAVPAQPFMLVGQMSAADPTRSPPGAASVWAYTHVPHEVGSDAGDAGIRGVWDHDDLERMADRMQARVERYAAGFGSSVLRRRVLGPREMQALDANLVQGSLNGGTSGLHQQLLLRPVPGLGRAETPIAGLYLGSASAHPGGGVHGACGSNAARAALKHDIGRRVLPFRRAGGAR